MHAKTTYGSGRLLPSRHGQFSNPDEILLRRPHYRQSDFGKSSVTGTRIPVQSVLELVRENVPIVGIIPDYYRDLESNDIRACIQ